MDDLGLSDFLLGEEGDLSRCLRATNVPGLTVMTAGTKRTSAATELLASARMISLLQTLERSDPGRIMVFDSPPLLLSTEARSLAASMGQVVLVIQVGVTTQEQVLEATAAAGVAAVSLVLNKASSNRRRSYAGYGSYGT